MACSGGPIPRHTGVDIRGVQRSVKRISNITFRPPPICQEYVKSATSSERRPGARPETVERQDSARLQPADPPDRLSVPGPSPGGSPPWREGVGTGWSAGDVRDTQKTALGTADGGTADNTADLAGKVAGVAGLEPVTSAVTGQRSNQLSYTPALGSGRCSQSTVLVNDFVGVFAKCLSRRNRPGRSRGSVRQ